MFNTMVSARLQSPNSTSGKRILVICPFISPNVGGVESHIDDLIDSLSSRAIPVTLIGYSPLTTRVKAPFREIRGMTQIFRIPWPGRNLFHRLESYTLLELLYLFPILYLAALIAVLAHQTRYKDIHAHGMIAGAVTVGLPFVDTRVFTVHAIYTLNQRPFLRRALATIFQAGWQEARSLIKPRFLSGTNVKTGLERRATTAAGCKTRSETHSYSKECNGHRKCQFG